MTDMLNRMGEVSVALPVELARRHRIDHAPEVFFVKSGGRAPGLPGGSICVVSGLSEATLLREVREAAATGEAVAVAEVLHAHEEQLRRRGRGVEVKAEHETVEQAIAALPAITQVTYRGRSVAEGMPVHPDLQAMRVLIPYAGGELDPAGFTASTYRLGSESRVEVDTVVVVREPELSALERKVLERLPREINQLALGRGDIVANWGLAAAGLVFVAVVVGGVLLAEYAQRQVQEGRQQQEQEMERQVAGDQGQQDQGQQDQGQQDQQDDQNGGSLGRFFDLEALAAQLEGLEASAAVTELVELRSGLMLAGRLR